MDNDPSQSVPLTSIEIESNESSPTRSASNSSRTTSVPLPSSSNHNRIPSIGGANNKTETPFWLKAERNIFYVKDQLEAFFASRTGPGSSTFVPIVCGTVLLLYLINLLTKPDLTHDDAILHSAENDPAFQQNAPPLVEWFTVTPGHALSPRHWIWSAISMFTYPFIELYFYQVILDIIVVALSTTLIEPLWGKKELITFFLVINLSVAILTMIHYIVIYTVSAQ